MAQAFTFQPMAYRQLSQLALGTTNLPAQGMLLWDMAILLLSIGGAHMQT